MEITLKNFNIQQIADSGQCFRMNKIGTNKYANISNGKYIELTQVGDIVNVSCSEEEWSNYWYYYFHLDFDYGKIVELLQNGDDSFLKDAVNYGSGIRILRQESFEMLISFIISQRKNIPAIKTCIEKLCDKFGEKKVSANEKGEIQYRAFPTPEALANATIEELDGLGLGYRSEYVKAAARRVHTGNLVLSSLVSCDYDRVISRLKDLYGVGDKVANCVALFGLGHIEAFPVDVWIERIIHNEYDGCFEYWKYKGFAGIVQQYMFYYYRNK